MSEKKFILRSKAVFDGVADAPRPAAVAVCGSRIEAVLPWDYAAQPDCTAKYGSWELADCGAKLLMPSFIDSHTHLFSGAINDSDFVCTELDKGRSQEECAQIIAEFAQKHPEYERIRGAGWFVGNWDEAVLPDKLSLDALIPDRPVYLYCSDCHSMWLNSKALEEARIDPDLRLENGTNVKFANGELSGLLLEPAACAPAVEKYMDFTPGQLYSIHQSFQRKLAGYGIAGASEMFADDYVEDTYKRYDVLKKLDEEQGLCAYVFAYTKLFGYTDFAPYYKMKAHFNSPHFSIAGVKGFIDGVTETHTGLLLEPYTDRPETCGDGLPLWPQEKMQREIIAANKEGIQVRLHCIGDGAVRMALDMYERSAQLNGKAKVPNTIEHIENIHPDDIGRFAKIGVTASMQPYHLTLANNKKIDQIGPERCKLEWPIHTLIENGAQMAIGTDYPVVTIDPFVTVYTAVTRRDDNGEPTGHNPWEAISMAEVLKGYTANAAQVYGAGDYMGTIEAGKLANMIVLSRNLFEIEPEAIKQTKVEANYFEGERIL